MLEKVLARLSTLLFHITSVRAAANILKTNRFELKPSDGTAAEESVATSYYLSCARSLTSDYLKQTLWSTSAVIQLDGQKLGQKYRGRPVDYWQDKSYKNEMEDRVLAPTQFLPAKPYILSISVVYNDKVDKAHLYRLKYLCSLNKIKLWVYADAKDLLINDPRRRITVDWTTLRPAAKPAQPPDAYTFKYRGRQSSDLAAWLTLYKLPEPQDYASGQKTIKAQGWERLDRIVRMLAYSDAVKQLSAEMHNAKSDPYDSLSKNRERLDELVKVLRQNKWTPQQFCDALAIKWKMRSRV